MFVKVHLYEQEYGYNKIFMEKQSGAKSDREELAKALDYLREGAS